jgi:hypothetical protein
MNTGMNTLLTALDSAIVAGITEITSTEQILQTTRPLPQPKRKPPVIYLVPEESEKILEDNDSSTELMYHIYRISIIIITSYKTTQEASLTDSDNGLVQLMDDIETLLESDTLSATLTNVNIYPETYAIPIEDFIDNIYTRGGILRYEAIEKPYNSTIHRT